MSQEQVSKTSINLADERLKQLRQLFPEAFREGKIDFDALKTALGDEAFDSKAERYTFTWAGKRDATHLAQTPSRATLIPVPEESVNWETTSNIFVEGDNLEVLKLLGRSYFGRVKMIYIDPPYNTGNDFVYPDNYADPLENYLRMTGQIDENGNLLSSNTEKNGRFHSAWLSMMYPRLVLARQFLGQDGVILVSIDDNEMYNLHILMNEIFGEENFVGQLIWKRRQNVDSRAKTGLSVDHEYAVIYRKNGEGRIRGGEKDLSKYANPDNNPRGPWSSDNLAGLATKDQRPNLHYNLIDPKTGISYPCPETGWRYSRDTMARLIADERIIFPSSPTGRPRFKRYLNELLDEFTGLSSVLNTVFNLQGTRELKNLFDGHEVIDFPKPVEYIKLLIQQATTPDGEDVVLDFFAGSCTTAQAVFELNELDGGNRRFIMVQLPELLTSTAAVRQLGLQTIAEVGKERIRRVISKMRSENKGKLLKTSEDLGFRVFKLALSNYRQWQETEDTDQIMQQLALMAQSLLVDGWKPGDVIFEVAVKEGYGLNIQVNTLEELEGNTVYRVTDPDKVQTFHICLDEHLPDDLVRRIGLKPDDVFICLDRALDDTRAANFALQSRLKTL
jgi:adenine-specific DNA-methyltransferase